MIIYNMGTYIRNRKGFVLSTQINSPPNYIIEIYYDILPPVSYETFHVNDKWLAKYPLAYIVDIKY